MNFILMYQFSIWVYWSCVRECVMSMNIKMEFHSILITLNVIANHFEVISQIPNDYARFIWLLFIESLNWFLCVTINILLLLKCNNLGAYYSNKWYYKRVLRVFSGFIINSHFYAFFVLAKVSAVKFWHITK